MEVTKLPKPSMQGAAAGGIANRRAVTCVNAEQASKLLMRESSRLRTAKAHIAAATERPSVLRSCRGSGDGALGQFSAGTSNQAATLDDISSLRVLSDDRLQTIADVAYGMIMDQVSLKNIRLGRRVFEFPQPRLRRMVHNGSTGRAHIGAQLREPSQDGVYSVLRRSVSSPFRFPLSDREKADSCGSIAVSSDSNDNRTASNFWKIASICCASEAFADDGVAAGSITAGGVVATSSPMSFPPW